MKTGYSDKNNDKFDYYHILPEQGFFVVKGYDTWPEGSVLEGQVRINFIKMYSSFDEAKEEYPQAELSHSMVEPVNTFNHLSRKSEF